MKKAHTKNQEDKRENRTKHVRFCEAHDDAIFAEDVKSEWHHIHAG